MNLNEFRSARVKVGLSQTDLARKLGISNTAMSNKELGIAQFKDSEKIKLCKILNLTLSQFNDCFFDGKLPYEEQKAKTERRNAYE